MKKKYQLLLFLTWMICFMAGPGPDASARSYYVAPGGDDANPGTSSRPWKTLSMASRQARAGDKVMIGSGTYAEMLEITRSGTSTDYIVFKGNKRDMPVIDATGRRHGVIIWNASCITVQGLRVRNSLRSGIHIHDHLDEVDCGADYNVIKGNTIQGCGGQGLNGIYVGGHHNRVLNNQVLDNGEDVIYNGLGGHGIYVLGNGNRVSGNYVARSARAGIRMEGENNYIKDNRILNNRDFGLTVWVDPPLKGKNIHILRNEFEANIRGGISIYGQGQGQKPDGIYISENNIYHQKAGYGIRLAGGVRNISINGNHLSGHYDKAFFYVDEESGWGLKETNNMFCGSGSFYYLGKEYADFEGYKAASRQAEGSSFEGLTSVQPGDCKQ